MEVIWGECCGIDIGYYYEDIDEKTDCLVLLVGSSGWQIDTFFENRALLNLDSFSVKPFGCWRVKR